MVGARSAGISLADDGDGLLAERSVILADGLLLEPDALFDDDLVDALAGDLKVLREP